MKGKTHSDLEADTPPDHAPNTSAYIPDPVSPTKYGDLGDAFAPIQFLQDTACQQYFQC